MNEMKRLEYEKHVNREKRREFNRKTKKMRVLKK